MILVSAVPRPLAQVEPMHKWNQRNTISSSFLVWDVVAPCPQQAATNVFVWTRVGYIHFTHLSTCTSTFLSPHIPIHVIIMLTSMNQTFHIMFSCRGSRCTSTVSRSTRIVVDLEDTTCIDPWRRIWYVGIIRCQWLKDWNSAIYAKIMQLT